MSVPDWNMDSVCHVTMKLSGLSVPDCNMDCVRHVTMKWSELSVPDCNMDCVCHVTMKLSEVSVSDCNLDCVCHVATDVSGLSIPNVHMESDHVYHVNKIEFDIESVPTYQEPWCKCAIQLAYMSSLVLDLGDVELNQGPRQNVVNTKETTQECESENHTG